MILYHGSNTYIDAIDLTKSKPSKDFGKGFYLSDSHHQAFEMAKLKTLILGGEKVVTEFQFDEKLMSSGELKVLTFDSYSEAWLDFILLNRTSKSTAHDYDIVYGPIANDKVGAQIFKYYEHGINKAELLERLKFMKGITFQYFFGTEKAISYLKRIEK